MSKAAVQHFEKLDGIRGFGAIMVILAHSRFFADEPWRFVENGQAWVDLFFVLSGFVMAYAYQDSLGKGTGFRRYFIPRIGRLLPLHVTVLLAWLPYILLKGGTETHGSADAEGFFRTLFLLNSVGLDEPTGWNGPSWSISAEVIAYLLFFGFCLAVTGVRARAWIAGTLAIASWAGLALMFPVDDMLRVHDYGFLRGVGGFFAGVCLYQLKSLGPATLRVPGGWPVWSLELLSGGAVIASLSLLGETAPERLLTLASMAVFVAVLTVNESGGIGRLLKTKVMQYLGEISYSLYMTHALVVVVATGLLVSRLREPGETLSRPEIIQRGLEGNLAFLANIALVLAVVAASALTYRYIEAPLRDKAKQIARRY